MTDRGTLWNDVMSIAVEKTDQSLTSTQLQQPTTTTTHTTTTTTTTANNYYSYYYYYDDYDKFSHNH